MEQKITTKRLERKLILLQMAQEAFPDAKEYDPDYDRGASWAVRIDRKTHQGQFMVKIKPDDTAILDDPSDKYISRFMEGIEAAKEIFRNPDFSKGYCWREILIWEKKIYVANL